MNHTSVVEGSKNVEDCKGEHSKNHALLLTITSLSQKRVSQEHILTMDIVIIVKLDITSLRGEKHSAHRVQTLQ